MNSLSSRIKVEWVPVQSGIFSQTLEKSLSSTGPWTVLQSGLGPTVSSYYDYDIVDNPFTDYYYRIITNCGVGGTTTSNVLKVRTNNCGNVGTSVFFGLYSTNAGLNVSFNYYDTLAEAYSFTPNKTVVSPAGKIRVVCHKCGELVQPTGAFAQYGDVSYLSSSFGGNPTYDINNICGWLPVSPSGFGPGANNRGSIMRKVRMSSTVPLNDTVHFGSGTGNTFVQTLLSSGTYTFKNHKQLRLGKGEFGTPYAYRTSTDLLQLNNPNLHLAIVNPGNEVCEIYIYQVVRNSNLDYYNANTNTEMYGFNLTYVTSYILYNNHAIYSTQDDIPYTFNVQPDKMFKFFYL